MFNKNQKRILILESKVINLESEIRLLRTALNVSHPTIEDIRDCKELSVFSLNKEPRYVHKQNRLYKVSTSFADSSKEPEKYLDFCKRQSVQPGGWCTEDVLLKYFLENEYASKTQGGSDE